MIAAKAKCKIWKRKQTKTHLIQFQLFILNKQACLQKNIHWWVLSIWVFSSDWHYGLIVCPNGWTLLSHMINLNPQESEKI